ncbi:MAG: sodium/hydrogen exchanger, partial [uncultured Blastococcus sp.]
ERRGHRRAGRRGAGRPGGRRGPPAGRSARPAEPPAVPGLRGRHGRERARRAVRGLRAHPDAGVRRARRHPRRGRPHHPVGRRPPGDRARHRAVHGRRRGERGRDGGRRRAAPRLRLGLRPAPGGGDQLHRRRGRLRHPAAAAPPAPGRRLAGGRERPQRRPGHPARDRPGRVAHRCGDPALVARRRGGGGGARRRCGRRHRDRFRGRRAAAPRGPARGRLLPAGHAGALRARVLVGDAGPHLGLRRGLPVRGRARQRGGAAPHRQHRLRRGHGLPGADRPVRPARSPGVAGPAAGGGGPGARRGRRAAAAGPAVVGGGQPGVVPVPVGPARVHLLGRAPRGGADRRGHHPADRGRPRGDDGVRHRVRAGRRLHRGAGLVAAVGGPEAADRHPGHAPRRAGGGRAAGRAGRGPHAADRLPGVPAARRLPARAPAARGRRRRADRPARAVLRAGRDDPAHARGPGPAGLGPPVPARGRAAAASGQPGGPAGELARRGRPGHRARL